MLKFLLGIAAAVAVVVLLARAFSPIAVEDLAPGDAASDPAITFVQTCEQSGGKAIVRTLPDGGIEGVQCS